MAAFLLRKLIALYLRISKKDEDGEEFESNSIGNQRGILYEYVKNNLDETAYEIREFVDDGYSGTSMDRPAMQELLKLAQSGVVYAILVKDLSRFARNYIEIGNYIEKIFPYIGIRFISVNDQYDSEQVTNRLPGLDMAFKGIIHDYYCKELSQKLKATRKLQVKKGKGIMSKPPYGYWKSAAEKGLLVIDQETAPVVRKIFFDYLDGMSAYGIAKELNQQNIDPPNKRLAKAEMVTFDEHYTAGLCWNTGTVLSILKNRIYIGDMVGNKLERIKISVNRCRKLEEAEWVIVENTHEPIIERKTFELVQKRLSENSCPRKNPVRGSVGTLFQGMLICGNCNAVMAKNAEIRGVVYYGCAKCRMAGRKPVGINSNFLEKKISAELPAHCPDIENGSIMQKRNISEGQFAFVGEKSADRHGKKEEINKELLYYYEKYADGQITREEYMTRREKLQNEKPPDCEKMAGVNVEASHEECYHENELIDRSLLEKVIDRIIVHDHKSITICWTQKTEDSGIVSAK